MAATTDRRRARSLSRGSLLVVGVGINGPPQTTLEAMECIQQADKVFYLVSEPITRLWIERLNPTAATLDDLYAPGKPRDKTYQEMTDRLLSAVRAGHRVCAAFYGHPGVFVNASHWAVRRARREGYHARMFPGVSAEACLIADLGVNPGDHGLQSYEATDFLAARRRFDPTSPLVLFQVGALGEPSVRKGMASRPERLQVLVRRLSREYPAGHRVVLYEAATFAASKYSTRGVRLDRLSRARILPIATLFVPALPQRKPDSRIVRWYDED